MRTASLLASVLLAACSSGGLQSSADAGPNAAVDASVKADGATNTAADASADSADASVAETSTKTDPTCSAQTRENDACTAEGAFCQASPCTDECQFCNSLHCQGGKWSRMEAFPMPESYCATVPCGSATCGKGEFCIRSHSGPAPIDGGSGVAYECGKLPSGCTACGCAEAATTSCVSTSCSPDVQTGKPLVDCFHQ